MRNNDKLNKDLAKNLIRFGHYKNCHMESVCNITIGGKIAVQTNVEEGQEEEVLKQMASTFWSVKESVGEN